MRRLRNIAMCDYQESVTTGQTDGQTDAGQSDPYVPLCFAGDIIRAVRNQWTNRRHTIDNSDSFQGHCYKFHTFTIILTKGICQESRK